MSDFLTAKLAEIEGRIQELKEELSALESAAAALGGAKPGSRRGGGRSASRSNGGAAGAPRRRKAASPKAASGRRRGRPKGSGSRGAEALALVQAQPGITIPELARGMGIKQNYLYRVMPQLHEDGKVIKRGRGWHPAKPAAAKA